MKALFFVFKWLIVPGVIGVTGFFILGPYLGRVPDVDKKAGPLIEMLDPSRVSTDNPDPSEIPQPDQPSVIVNGSGVKADHRRRHDPRARVLNEGRAVGGSSEDSERRGDL